MQAQYPPIENNLSQQLNRRSKRITTYKLKYWYLLELLEDSRDGGAERDGIVAEADDVTIGTWNAEDSGGALLLERGGDLFGNHLELHLQIDQVLVQRVFRVPALSRRVYPFLWVEVLARERS